MSTGAAHMRLSRRTGVARAVIALIILLSLILGISTFCYMGSIGRHPSKDHPSKARVSPFEGDMAADRQKCARPNSEETVEDLPSGRVSSEGTRKADSGCFKEKGARDGLFRSCKTSGILDFVILDSPAVIVALFANGDILAYDLHKNAFLETGISVAMPATECLLIPDRHGRRLALIEGQGKVVVYNWTGELIPMASWPSYITPGRTAPKKPASACFSADASCLNIVLDDCVLALDVLTLEIKKILVSPAVTSKAIGLIRCGDAFVVQEGDAIGIVEVHDGAGKHYSAVHSLAQPTSLLRVMVEPYDNLVLISEERGLISLVVGLEVEKWRSGTRRPIGEANWRIYPTLAAASSQARRAIVVSPHGFWEIYHPKLLGGDGSVHYISAHDISPVLIRFSNNGEFLITLTVDGDLLVSATIQLESTD